MLKFRNISLLRRIYVWGLSILTRLAYAPDQREVPPEGDVHPSAARIRRINSELEFGPRDWQKEFLQTSQFLSPPHRQDPFHLADITTFLNDGIEALVNDTLIRCFTEQPTHPWNFLTRNIPPGPWRMTPYQSVLWAIGMWARYCVLLPFRVLVVVCGVAAFVSCWIFARFLPGAHRKRVMRQWLLRALSSVVVVSWSGYVRFHGQRPRRGAKQIYVSNHTSLLDFFILNKDYNFSCIGQRHGGIAGLVQDLYIKAQYHVCFDREEGNDRRAVQQLLRDHVADGSKEPMLVFPEGTCTHSQYCVMFKKGSFELDATVHPIAMRYRHRFADPFWNSQRVHIVRHVLDLMTSWAVVCDVYYMEPQRRRDNESAAQFANRVKRMICERAGLISMNWDGFLKRNRISPKFQDARQRALASIIMRRLSGDLPRADSTMVLEGADGGIPQTSTNAVTGGPTGDLDSLGFDKMDVGECRARQMPAASIYREVLSLRLTRRDPPREFSSPMVRFVAGAMHHMVRWMVAMCMLAAAAMVTNRFMPKSLTMLWYAISTVPS